ncbi:MAG TPA: hypothetical protein DD677_05085, partial [Stenotrophomonas sp.]|nr:hypothetical protein [Stenotrophomonas sp.]
MRRHPPSALLPTTYRRTCDENRDHHLCPAPGCLCRGPGCARGCTRHRAARHRNTRSPAGLQGRL